MGLVNCGGKRAGGTGDAHGHARCWRCLQDEPEDDEEGADEKLHDQEEAHEEGQARVLGDALRHGGCCPPAVPLARAFGLKPVRQDRGRGLGTWIRCNGYGAANAASGNREPQHT